MDLNGLIDYCNKINLHTEIGAKTAPLTSIKVGNTAKIIVYPHNLSSFCQILSFVKENNFKFFVLGNGTNVFFCDNYDGVVIVTTEINNIEINGDILSAESGASIFNCAKMALYHSLSGLEFAYGIPGTIGGALHMNAEAFSSRISDVVYKSVVYNVKKREVIEIENTEHLFSSKSSIFSTNKDYFLLKTYLKFKPDDFDKIRESMLLNMNKRVTSQPLNLPNFGSTFKRSEGIVPSKLIDECGLKGYKVGGAQVSEKHAGFIVNTGNTNAKEINELIEHIKRSVYNKFNVKLEEEIIYVK